MQYFTQYYQSNSRKIQIDIADIMNAFCKAMFLLSYSFIRSRISRVYFRNVCLKIANFHNLSKNRQIHVINRCQLMVFMPLFYNRIKNQCVFVKHGLCPRRQQSPKKLLLEQSSKSRSQGH